MSYEVELLKAWMVQGQKTEDDLDGTPIPPVMPKALPGGHTYAWEAISEGAFSAEQIDAAPEPDGDRSEPPPGYIVQDTPKALAPSWWGPANDEDQAHYSESSHESAVAACWAHRDAVLASVEPTPTGDPPGFEQWYEDNANDHYEHAPRDAAMMVWDAALASRTLTPLPEGARLEGVGVRTKRGVYVYLNIGGFVVNDPTERGDLSILSDEWAAANHLRAVLSRAKDGAELSRTKDTPTSTVGRVMEMLEMERDRIPAKDGA